MKRLPLLLLLVIAVGFLSCSEDEGPTGPVMTAPDSLTAVALSESQVYLEWIDTTPFELGYRVQRALSGSVSWNLVTDSLEMDANHYTDSGLEEGTVYNYRVKAFNARGETEPSNVVEITTLAAAPSGLVAEQDSSNFTSVNLTWIDESGKETGFQIQRKQGRNGEYEIIGETDADSTSFLDEGLEPNALYFYQVRAMIDVLGSHWSNEDWARTNVLTPLPPSNLEAEATSPNTIRLRWNDNAIDNDGFILERSLDEESGWAAIATLEDVEAHVDGNLYDETTYYYRLAAYNSYGNSDYSNVASATTPAGPPLAPSNLRLENATYYSVTLNWNDNSNDELGFNLQRDHRGMWEAVSDIGPNLTIFTDTTTTMNTTYRYRIRSFNTAGASSWSTTLELTTPNGPPEAPRNLEAQVLSTSSIRLSWVSGISGNQDGFILERASEETGGIFEQITEVERNVYSYQDEELQENTLYTYRVYAFNEIDRSANSEEVEARTWSLIVLDDGFEDYTSGLDPPDPWAVTSRGGSFARVSNTDPHTGVKHVQIADPNPNEVDSASAALTTITRPVEKGSLTCWLKIAEGGFFGLMGGDDRNYITFQMQFNDDGSVMARSGGGIGLVPGVYFTPNQWFKLDLEFDVRTRLYRVSFDDVDQFIANLQRTDHPANTQLFFMTYVNATIDFVNIDDVMILDTVDEEEALSAPVMLPGGGEGDLRIGEVVGAVGPVR